MKRNKYPFRREQKPWRWKVIRIGFPIFGGHDEHALSKSYVCATSPVYGIVLAAGWVTELANCEENVVFQVTVDHQGISIGYKTERSGANVSSACFLLVLTSVANFEIGGGIQSAFPCFAEALSFFLLGRVHRRHFFRLGRRACSLVLISV